MHADLARHLKTIECQIALGRILATCQPSFVGRSMESSRDSGDQTERLRIDLATGQPVFQYALSNARLEFVVDISSSGGEHAEGFESLVTIEFRSLGDHPGTLFLFEQSAENPLRVTVGDGESRRVVEETSLWTLLLTEPELRDQYLLPALQRVRPGWDLTSQTRRVVHSLHDLAHVADATKSAQWSMLIDDLGSPRFAVRRAADRELRAQGRELLPFLLALDRSRLDSEQQHHVQSILQSLAPKTHAPTWGPRQPRDDSPDAVAISLAPNSRVWHALLDDEELAVREVAAEHVQRVWGKPVRSAPQADNPASARQRDE